MERAYRLRIYPNKNQIELLEKTFGCVRYIYNYFLNRKIILYKENNINLTYNECSKELTQLKKENKWLKVPDKCALQNALRNLDTAYQIFLKKEPIFLNLNQKNLIKTPINLVKI